MNNAEKFKLLFDIYATELWSMSEADFLKWLNEDVPDANVCDTISRQAAIDFIDAGHLVNPNEPRWSDNEVVNFLKSRPSAQPEQRYTEEELRVFAHGISLSLLSKRSAQHWRYDKDTATEIEFLERLYEKVGADIRGEEV